MNTMNYFDYVTLNIGWLINNTLWYIIATSGIVTIPFILKIFSIFIKAREQGVDEGNQGILIINWLEVYVYLSILVIFSTCIPILSPDFKIMQYKQSDSTCSYEEALISDSKFQSINSQFDGQEVKIPIWWYGIHSLSRGLTQSAVTALPCSTDIRQIQTEIQSLKISDPILLEDVQDFHAMCFNPSYNKIRKSFNRLSKNDALDVSWIGSSLFLNSPGYYDSFRATTPRRDWQYDSVRDVGLNPGPNFTGYPSCKEWWSDTDVGLKVKLMTEVENQKNYFSLSELWYNTFGRVFKDLNERDETLLRSLVNPDKLIGTSDNLLTNYSGDYDKTVLQHIGSFFSTAGLALSSTERQVEMDAFRQAAPMIQSILLMCIVILMPIVITLGGFEPRVILTLTFVLFAIIFLTFIWELGRFLDTQLIEMIYDGSQAENSLLRFLYLDRGIGDVAIMRILTSVVFIAFPVLLLAGMSWAGIRIGAELNGALGKMAQTTQEAGSQGAKMAKSVAKAAVTRGRGK